MNVDIFEASRTSHRIFAAPELGKGGPDQPGLSSRATTDIIHRLI